MEELDEPAKEVEKRSKRPGSKKAKRSPEMSESLESSG